MKSGKIVVVGDGACGKTCLLEVFRRNKFPEEYVPTVVDNFVKNITLDDGTDVSLALWDTAGQEDYNTIRPLSYQETDLVLLCYTIENKKNLSNIDSKWVAEIKNYCPGVGYFLVGLKEDLRYEEGADKDSLITTDDGKRVAGEIKAVKFFECSALTKKNVDTLFKSAGEYINKRKEKRVEVRGWCGGCFGCC